MSLIAIAGINGVGKGTIIRSLTTENPNIIRISLTKILMQHFRIAPPDEEFEPSTEMYRQLGLISYEDKLSAIDSAEIIAQLRYFASNIVWDELQHENYRPGLYEELNSDGILELVVDQIRSTLQ